MKALYIVISVALSNILQSLHKRPTIFLTLANLRCSSNVNFKSMTPRCFWEKVWETLMLKTKGGWVDLFDLQLRMASWACLLGSGLKLIFHWKPQSLTFFKSSFNSLAEVFTSWTTENNDVSSAKVLHCLSNYLINHLYRLRIKMDLEQILVELHIGSWRILTIKHNPLFPIA